VAHADAVDHRERELKFDIPPDWELPDPARLAPRNGSVEHTHARLETTYFDTRDQALLRSRITLRRRVGDTDQGWQLKVPDGDARTELRLPLGGRGVPAELREATLGVRCGAALQPLATLVTEREIHRLLDADATALAELVVDSVTAVQLRDAGETKRWREVEVELVEGDEKLLQRVAKWVIKNGAEKSVTSSKLARALDFDAAEPRATGRLSGLVANYLDAQADVIVRGDIELRRGRNAVHTTRVGTRRYRSALRVLGALFDAERVTALDAELAWFGAALGTVRDRHVLRAHLDEALADVAPELVMSSAVDRIHETLDAQEQDAVERLAGVLRSKRYYALLEQLRQWRERPPVVADEPAENVASHLARARRKARRRVARAPHGDGRAEALHSARKAAKRARYIAELSRPQLGSKAKSIQKQMKQTQRRLGVLQDCVVAAEFLRHMGAAAASTGENGFTYGVLYQREIDRVQQLG
jgi:CHAD domain-containing protein